jgi:putative FmdB family regulatory protein
MPIYEYDCPICGDFTALRPMSQCRDDSQCPECGSSSPRVIRSTPNFAAVSGATRRAHETNERSSHAPQSLAEYANKRKHASGCSCCAPSKPLAPTKANPHALKGKPAGRPWMISH